MTSYTEISVLEADSLLANQNPLIIDARDAHSYKEQHIEGAMHGHGGLVEHLIKMQNFERPVLVYCYHGNSSKDLAEVFGRAGYKNAYSMKGGFTAWKKRNTLYAQNAFTAETTKWLLDSGFEALALNTTIANQVTPLILACQQGNENVVLELLAAGADVNHIDGDGNNALWAAIYGNNNQILDDLIAVECKVDLQNNEGATPLIYAASAGKTEAVKALLAAKADTTLKTKDDFTALDLAANKDILNLLK